MLRVGMVIQRYGAGVVGGAETLARDLAERLNASGCDVTVFTTTARDYLSWRNEFPAGDSILKGVVIRRFNSARERDIEAFNHFSAGFFDQPPDERDEEKWFRLQGPFCPDLIDGLREAQKEIDIFIFCTYLYYPTVAGLKAVEKPSVLFPTAHDEAPIYLRLMADVFKKPNALCFLTGAEMELAQRLFQPQQEMALIRTGLDIRDHIPAALFKKRYLQFAPYLLYAGRIERGKGLETVFEAYNSIRKHRLAEFVLIGKKLMDLPPVAGVKYMGFVSEEEKLSAFRGAVLSVQPSALESLSITTLESFSQKTPVLVNRQSGVLREHIELSGGGYAYENADEFCEAFNRIYDQRREARKLGEKGYRYLKTCFSWPVVIADLKERLERIVRENRPRPAGTPVRYG